MLFRTLLILSCLACAGRASMAESVATTPIPLRDVANRGFRDAVAGDGKGGWTDQGPDNDLGTLRSGKLTAGGITFEVLDPNENQGRSTLVLGQASQRVAHDPGEAARAEADAGPGRASSATLEISGQSFRALYLLHAAAIPPRTVGTVGRLRVEYADGSRTIHDVQNRRDVANWRDPFPAENAGIAWESENPTASIGLFVSGFELEDRPMRSITFEQSGPGAWMIVGLSGSAQRVQVGVTPTPLTIEPGNDWAPYDHSLDIAPGGVFDFSHLLDAPAGKYGAIRATPAGHFEFAERPGDRVRFWGVNLCFSAQFLEQAEADLLAERLARSGYNTVRFHHFDGALARDRQTTGELNADALDRLDYLFAALKRRGIYINIDLFASRPFSVEEVRSWGVPETLRGSFKSLLPINDGAFESWAHFATQLLTHRNPYTGLTWAEDPALIGICPVNENPLFNRIENPSAIFAMYAEAFAAAGLPGPAASSNPEFNRFIHETNRASDARMAEHLRSLGTKALLTGANYTISQGLAYVREHYDYVDCHSYWDHPKFPEKSWALPIAFGQGSSVHARAKMPNRIMPTRIFGLPFVSTEFNFCRPNRYRYEGAVLMPAYASLQDWDGMYNFQYAMSREMAIHSGTDNYFAIANDPIGLIGDRVSALLFQRGDIAPASGAIAYAVRPDEAFSALGRLFPGDFALLGLVTRIGSLTGEPDAVLRRAQRDHGLTAVVTGSLAEKRPARAYAMGLGLPAELQRDGVLPEGSIDAENTRYRSDTGEIELRPEEGTATVVTPRSELFLVRPGSELNGDRIHVRNGETAGAIAVITLDVSEQETLSLDTARRILITHLTDALPSGMRFSHTDRKLLTAWGDGPHLLAKSEAELTLRLPPGEWRAWAVGATGARTREVPLERQGGVHRLHLSTISPEGTQLAYELAR